MEITKENTRPKRLQILIDGAPWKEVSTSIFGKRCKLPAPASTLEEWERAFAKLEKERVRRYLAFLLSKRDYPSDALRRKLKENLVSPDAIELLLQQLTKAGYLDDKRYAEQLIEGCRRQGKGESYIKTKLQTKGLSPTYLEEMPAEDPMASAERAWQTISKRYNVEDPKEKQRAFAAMARRGFDWTTICAIWSTNLQKYG